MTDPRAQSEAAQEYLTIRELLAFAKRHILTIAMSLLLAIAIASAYTMTATPLYTARAQIYIDTKIASVLRDPQSEVHVSLDTAQIESDIAVLKSEGLGLLVIDRLGLRTDPEFTASGGLLRRLLGKKPLIPEDPSQRERAALRTLSARMDVRRIGLSYAIEIAFASPSPEKAEKVTNAIAEGFVQDQLDSRGNAARQGSEWLETRINKLRQLVNDGSRRVQEFKASHDYRFTSPRDTTGQRDRTADGDPLAMLRAAASPKGDLRSDQTTLEELESVSQTYRKIYESYLMAYAEVMQRQSYPIASARIITRATPPDSPSHPRSSLVLLLGGLIGLVGGFGAALVRHGLDRRVSRPAEVAALGVPCIAEIPTARIPQHVSLRYLARQGAVWIGIFRRMAEHAIGRNKGTGLDEGDQAHADAKDNVVDPRRLAALKLLEEAPFSPFGLAISALKSALDPKNCERELRSLGIISPASGSGTTFLAAALAQSMVSTGVRTLLVDCDRVRTAVDAGGSGQVTEFDSDGRAASRIIPGGGKRPDILIYAGSGSGGSDSEREWGGMRAKIEPLYPRYDMIIVDAPALSETSEGVTLCAALDGALVLVEADKTITGEAAEMIAALRSAKAKTLGVVINKAVSRAV